MVRVALREPGERVVWRGVGERGRCYLAVPKCGGSAGTASRCAVSEARRGNEE